MHWYVSRIPVLVAMCVLSTGCPTTGNLVTGTWFFVLFAVTDGENPNQNTAVDLNPGGSVGTFSIPQLPPGADNSFTGELEYWESGPRFVMVREVLSDVFVYRGTIGIDGTTITNGTWVSSVLNESGTFTASLQ